MAGADDGDRSSTVEPRAAARRRRSTLSTRGYTGPISIARPPPEPEPEPAPEPTDPFQLLLGPGALVLFALAAVVAVFPLGFLTDDPQWWAVIPPGISTVMIVVALVWTLRLRSRGELPLESNFYWGIIGGLVALLGLAGFTAARMWWQAQ